MKFPSPLVIGCLGALVSLSHAELSPVQRVEYGGGTDQQSFDFQSEPVILDYSEELTGFTKFDPSLGTLTRIIVTAEVSATYSAELYSSSLQNSGDLFSLYSEDSEIDLLQVSATYNPGSGNSILALTFDIDSPGSLGEEFLDPDEYGGENDFFYSDFVSFDFGGFSNGDMMASQGEILTSDEDFVASDFIGTGNVTTLGISFFGDFSNGTEFGSLENLDFATFEPSITLNSGAVTLQYEYIPAATSTPLAVSSYTLSGNQHTIQFTGPPGETAWMLKGGSDLVSFPNDHTANAVFTEPSPGNYQVVATLTGLPDGAYFFIIEST